MERVKVLIVDDHQMLRQGLRFMLENLAKNRQFLVDEAKTGEEGLEKAKKNHFDLILMDYQLPGINGSEAIRRIVARNNDIKILALSNYDEYAYVMSLIKAGARGFILKNVEMDEFMKAVNTILDGGQYYCNEIAVKLISASDKLREQRKNTDEGEVPKVSFTGRELEVLALIYKEYTNDEIAAKLHVTKSTVDKYRQVLLEKLQAKNTVGLIKRIIELKVFDEKN